MRRKKDHILLLLLLTAGLLAGCAADDIQTDGDGSEIRFNVAEWQSMDATRATAQPEGTITSGSFQVDAYLGSTDTKYIDDQTVNNFGGQWTMDNRYYWPLSDNLTFVAYRPTDFDNTCISKNDPYYTYANGPSFVCTDLPMTSAGQYMLKEFVYAVAKDQNKAAQGSAGVTLTFKHTLAKMMLRVKRPHRKVTINKITFKSLYNNGTYVHNTATWTPSGSQTDLVITPDPDLDLDVNATELTNISIPYLLFPQTYSPANQIEVKLQYWKMDGSGKEPEVTVTFNNPISTWEIGKLYNYTLDLSENENIRFGVFIEDWDDYGVADIVNFTYDINLMIDVESWWQDGVADAVSFSYDADFMLNVDDWKNDGTNSLDYNN